MSDIGNDNDLEPDIRFRRFTDTWGKCKLSELANFSKGKGYSKNDLISEGYPIILYGRLYTNYETSIETVDTFVSDDTNAIKSESGDVIVPGSGETAEDISRASNVEAEGIIIGGDLNVIKPKKRILDSSFLAITISNGSQQKELTRRAQGKSIVHLHNSDLKTVRVTLPSLDEQRQLSSLFNSLDNLITVNQRKGEALQSLKKALLQKMFVSGADTMPDIRFRRFAGAWGKRKIGDFLVESRDEGTNGLEAKKLTVRLWGKGVVEKETTYEGSTATKYFTRHAGQFMYGKLDFLHAAFGIVPEELDGYESTLDSPAFDVKNLNSTFLLERVLQKNFFLYQGVIANGSRKAKRIHVDTFFNMSIVVPALEEQNCIGHLFESIDAVITVNRRKGEVLQSLKKALLQKMFV
ncbi:MAG: restriction endonuclease subunit S [Bifidobacteriaceae bacterium]|jgi:type I restriction enzyme S subunit|nr:restriction endonuclease subunit S [Bifidobacteriaceae bacterium]MCI1978560.1 restriction endonuclease subunit S [Bifidobacteriaceae bacterium]